MDVSAAEVELDSGPPEVLPEASAGDLGASAPSGAATSSFGDREAETSSGKSWTAGNGCESREVSRKAHCLSMCLHRKSALPLCLLPPVPWSSSAGNAGGLMFLRLRVQPSVGKTKGAGGLQMGASKPIHRKDAWLALSQERYYSRFKAILQTFNITIGGKRVILSAQGHFIISCWFGRIFS